MEFCERLKQLREEKGLTQKELGFALSYGSSAIANYESGRNQPSIQDLIKIAECFQVTMDYLLGIADTPQPPYLHLTPKELDFMSKILAREFFVQEDALAAILKPILQNVVNDSLYLSKKPKD